MTLVYATSGDLANWTGTTVPSNATVLLRSASILVRRATACDYYPTDATGLPTDTAQAQAFNDATCSQAAFWSVNGIDPLRGSAQPRVPVSKGIGTARIQYADAQMAAEAAAASLQELVPEAATILREAGLGSTAAWIVG